MALLFVTQNINMNANFNLPVYNVCISLPLSSDPPFEPKPSLQLIANHLVINCLRRYPLEECPLCNQRALPENPKVDYDTLSFTWTSHKQFQWNCILSYNACTCRYSIVWRLVALTCSIFKGYSTRWSVCLSVLLSFCLSVCLSVTTKSAAYIVYTSKTRYHRVLHGVF